MKRIKNLSLGLAVGAISLCSLSAQAQTSTTPMTDPMPAMGTTPAAGMDASMMTPMPVSGTVLRYYVDRSGFVTAMDVQTADGIRMVRFSPSLAQTLTSTFPVGSTASVYVTSSMAGGMTRYDLAGMGSTMPAPTSMMMPAMVSDLDILRAQPFTTIGAKSMMYSGRLTGFISDPKTGEVLAIVLDDKTLLRIPAENRLLQASTSPEGVTGLFAGGDVVAYGVPEAPRYGAVSPYAERVIATGISINGRPLGPFGFGRVPTGKRSTLLGLNIPFFGGKSPDDATAMGNASTPEEVSAMSQGYSPYMAPGTMPPAPDAMAPAPTTTSPTTPTPGS
ncbi:MAG TPA: hypothetical protein VF627_12515 [Abditibacterium sp.]|jgi:hypothetical protein